MKRVAGIRLVRNHVAVHDDAVGEGHFVDALEGNGCRVVILYEA
jgi:hypothetical protein